MRNLNSFYLIKTNQNDILEYMELNFPKLEKEILKFWNENKIFERSIKRRKKAKNFVFYEGPPTANALPGLHHVLARIFKDIICRYKTMREFKVERKAGWDTHGLPVELEIEKKLGLKSKKDIEKFGIAKFNNKCKESVWQYKKDWEKLTERIGFWLDMENPYITYDNDYIETVWWIIKQIWKKGLLYKDYKVVPYCPRCGTSLSSHEVAQGYERIKEPAIYIKFKILNSKDPKSYTLTPDTYLLVWTTTPWTLPGNVAIAANPNFIYVKAKVGNEIFILVKEKLNVLGKEYQVLEEIKGEDLVGLKYQPLFSPNYQLPAVTYTVIPGDFVSLEEGTGFVHIAPAFGEEDMEAIKMQNAECKMQNLPEFPILLNVNEEGKFKSEVKKWQGMHVKEADPLIIEDLKERNLLFRDEQYEHDYPFCWRCDSPLLYYAKESWFINMQKVKEDLIKNNEKINWVPKHLKDGRFGEWLKEVKDWALSRERYWGTPLPVWRCKKCQNLEVIGSKEDLSKQTFSQNKYFILRHGETAYQAKKKKILYDWPGLSTFPLTEKGEKKIKKVAKKLKNKRIDLIYSSDTLRTRQTAEIIANELELRIHFDPRLRDINLGIYQGREKKEFLRDFPVSLERFQKRVPGGDGWLDVKKRAIDFIKDVDKRHDGKTILIVSHGELLWLLEGGVMKGLTNEKLLEEHKKNFIKTGELRKIELKVFPFNEEGELDFHRPYIDEVKFYCPNCGMRMMERVPEVIDCWFDAGSMPFAQHHFPFENKKKFREQFPADFITEGIDQTRGWFYTLLAISTLLGSGISYKNVISLGLILDEKGEKMSKSKGNVVDPWYIAEKYGVDALRWYFYTVNQPGDFKLFSEKGIEEKLKKFILIFWNCYLFFETYGIRVLKFKKSKNILDEWIISKLNRLIEGVTKNLDNYDVTSTTRMIETFIVEDLSQWYIRRSRVRFQKPEKENQLKDASRTLDFVLLNLSKLTAPFIPFLSEEIYKGIKKSKNKNQNSVHLEDWPKVKEKWIKKDLNEKMDLVREIVGLGLELRAKAKIKVRQPLAKLKIQSFDKLRIDPERSRMGQNKKLKIDEKLLTLIKEELNVKEIELVEEIQEEKNWILTGEEGIKIALNIEITSQLKKEGTMREFIRRVQELRKQAGLKPKDQILIQFSGEKKLNELLMKNKNFILKKVKARNLQLAEKSKMSVEIEKEIEINGEKLYLGIKVSHPKGQPR